MNGAKEINGIEKQVLKGAPHSIIILCNNILSPLYLERKFCLPFNFNDDLYREINMKLTFQRDKHDCVRSVLK